MKISLDWLSDFVDLSGIATDEIVERLSIHTAEVDDVERVDRVTRDVVVGKITNVTRVRPDAPLPTLVEVDVGGRRLMSVCGAPNAKEGLSTAVALPGAVLAGGKRVEAGMLHGHRSEAVLCSPAEINLGPADDGIVELPPHLPPGTALETLVPDHDTIITIDNKSLTHRPDLWGQYGFARELAAIFRRELKPLDQVELSEHNDKPEVSVRVDAPEDCPFYGAIGFDVGPNVPSPLWMQRRLFAIGSRPRGILVDVTNYVQFELGQPLHGFDADKVPNVVVANSATPRQLTTLDGETRDILAEDLLIFGGSTPVAIAGVMGAHGSEISSATRRIVLESANFRAARVRVTSVRLALRTEASLRFEKKLPPVFARIAVGRSLKLLDRARFEYRVTSRFTTVGDLRDVTRKIELPAGYISRRAGAEIADDEAIRILQSIGFEARMQASGGIEIEAPSFRSVYDIATPEDISEEVMRLFGYDRIAPRLPSVPIDSPPLHKPTLNHHRARRILSQAHGFVEVHTYGWFTDPWLSTIGYTPSRRTLDLANPMASDRRSMRDALMPNLLSVVDQNRKNAEQFRIFELGKVFWIDSAGEKREVNELCGLIVDQRGPASRERLFASAREAIEDLARVAGVELFVDHKAPSEQAPPWERTDATVELLREGRAVGSMGILPKRLSADVLNAGAAAWFNIAIDEIAGEIYPSLSYVAPPVYPGSTQDFTFAWPRGAGYAQLVEILSGFSYPMDLERSFVDAYAPPGRDTMNYTFRFRVHRPDRTATGEEIQEFRNTLLSYAQSKGINSL